MFSELNVPMPNLWNKTRMLVPCSDLNEHKLNHTSFSLG
jgi:NAD(P)-dependent dehydrogenase (short-subunit alcohol dehydrogenase family)